MINVNVCICKQGLSIDFETLVYMYPFSLLKLEYQILDQKKQVKFLKVGYTKDLTFVVRSKNPIPDKVKQVLSDLLCGSGSPKFISTSNRNLTFH